MIKVWVLVFYMGHHAAGGPTVIDNIATKEECVRIQKIISYNNRKANYSKCIQVEKVK